MLKDNSIYNEDCISGMDRLEDDSVNLIITDPPYGILPNGKPNDKFNWDNIDLIPFTKKWFDICLKKMRDNSFMFIFWSQKYIKEGTRIFHPDRVLIWHYQNLVIGGGGDFAYDYEPIFVIKKGNPKLSSGKHLSVMAYTKPQSNFKKEKLLHPTQKPLDLIKKLIEISTNKDDLVLDPFIGSGTTAVACKFLDRRYIGFEIDKQYYKLAVNRLKTETTRLSDFNH